MKNIVTKRYTVAIIIVIQAMIQAMIQYTLIYWFIINIKSFFIYSIIYQMNSMI
jgi:hypothetical protein